MNPALKPRDYWDTRPDPAGGGDGLHPADLAVLGESLQAAVSAVRSAAAWGEAARRCARAGHHRAADLCRAHETAAHASAEYHRARTRGVRNAHPVGSRPYNLADGWLLRSSARQTPDSATIALNAGNAVREAQ